MPRDENTDLGATQYEVELESNHVVQKYVLLIGFLFTGCVDVLPIAGCIVGILPIAGCIVGILPIAGRIVGILPIAGRIVGILPITGCIVDIFPIGSHTILATMKMIGGTNGVSFLLYIRHAAVLATLHSCGEEQSRKEGTRSNDRKVLIRNIQSTQKGGND